MVGILFFTNKKSGQDLLLTALNDYWRPQGDLNPCLFQYSTLAMPSGSTIK